MALLTWTSTYSVKVDQMDEQHQKLFDMINEFYDSLGTQSNKELISNLVKGMKQYTILHFTEEEEMMKANNYPYLQEHQLEHAHFVAKVSEIEEKVNSGKLVISIELTNFLKNWIRTHIQKTDQRYTNYFVKQGIIE